MISSANDIKGVIEKFKGVKVSEYVLEANKEKFQAVTIVHDKYEKFVQKEIADYGKWK